MATIIPSLPNNLTNGTTADATQVMANFSAIVAAVNANAASNGVNTNISQLTGLTTPITVPQGGTGLASLPANGVLVGNGTGTLTVAVPNTAGYVLTSNGASATPSFQSLGLGTMANQNANSVAITGGTITGTTITGTASLDLQIANNLSDLSSKAAGVSNLLPGMTASGVGSLAIGTYQLGEGTGGPPWGAGGTYAGSSLQVQGPFAGASSFPFSGGTWLCLGNTGMSVGGWGGFYNFWISLFIRIS